MKDSKSIKKLIEKVKPLAERGEMGEKDSANEKLRYLYKVYKVKKSEERKNKKRSFKLLDFGDCKTIMVHSILDSSPTAEIQGNEISKELYCKLTDEQYDEVCQKFNYYYAEYIKQRESFLKAFILKNNLGIHDSISEETEESIDGILDMMNIVKVCTYKRKLIDKL